MKEIEQIWPVSIVNGLNQPDKIIYHYTSLKNMLDNIVGGQYTLKAGHLRFTNDDQEYYIGKEICEKISTKNQTNISTIEKKDQDVFVTCFSLNQDSRAMWSEYIRDEYGVSVGLDFRTGGKSCSGTKDNLEKHLAFKLLKPKDANDSKEKQQFSSSFYNRPYKVLYFIDEIKDYKNVNYEKEYINKKKLKNLINSSNHDRKTKDKIIPYIKHAAFVEEAECRLVFDYAPSVESFTDYYFYSENLFPVPFLLYTVAEHTETKSESYNMYVLYKRYKHITPGRTELDVEEKRIEIDVTLKELRENKNKSALLEKLKVKIFSEFELDNNQKNITHEIYIPAIFNSDMGKAADLYDKIQSLLEEIPYWPQNAKIWQLGRMPIRKIIVMRCSETDRIVDSLKSKFATIPWLKYVSVKPSSIPYRKTLNIKT